MSDPESGAEPERFSALFDDLEQQAEALYAGERELELADRSRAEYASVTLASRLMASLGRAVELEVEGMGPVSGVLERVGAEWCLVRADSPDPILRRVVIVPLAATLGATGVSERSTPEVAWSPVAVLGIGSALRRLADEGLECRVHRRDGTVRSGRIGRVGADFLELREGRVARPGLSLVPFAALAAVASPQVASSS